MTELRRMTAQLRQLNMRMIAAIKAHDRPTINWIKKSTRAKVDAIRAEIARERAVAQKTKNVKRKAVGK